jgi:RHS repeat-associated protein
LRVLPGQYFDAETGLSFNYFRDYDPSIGRYVESDPLGLRSGTNTYSYALNNALLYVDPFGLDVNFCYYPDGPTHIGYGISGESGTQGFYPLKPRRPIGEGAIKPDPQYEAHSCKTVTTTNSQDKCMSDCRDKRKKNPGTYSGVGRQCADFVKDCAAECHVPIGNGGGPLNLPVYLFEGIPGTAHSE